MNDTFFKTNKIIYGKTIFFFAPDGKGWFCQPQKSSVSVLALSSSLIFVAGSYLK
jgi:hypothetical protein